MSLNPCQCGLLRAHPRGVCVHCDRPARCEKPCGRCVERDSRCVVCKARCGTPAGAAAHEVKCREVEAVRERKA